MGPKFVVKSLFSRLYQIELSRNCGGRSTRHLALIVSFMFF